VSLVPFYENDRRDVRLKRLEIISGRNRFPVPRSSDIRKNPAYDGNVCDCRYRFRSQWFSAISEIARSWRGRARVCSILFSLSLPPLFLFVPHVCPNWISTVLFHTVLCNSQWPLFRSFVPASFPLPAFIVSAGRSRGSPAFSCFWSDNAYTSAHVPSIKRGGRKWRRRRGTRGRDWHGRTGVTKRAGTILCETNYVVKRAISVTFYIHQCRSPLYAVCTIFGTHGNLIHRLLFAINGRKHIKLVWLSELQNNYAQLKKFYIKIRNFYLEVNYNYKILKIMKIFVILFNV